jgi:hypothetical protein
MHFEETDVQRVTGQNQATLSKIFCVRWYANNGNVSQYAATTPVIPVTSNVAAVPKVISVIS